MNKKIIYFNISDVAKYAKNEKELFTIMTRIGNSVEMIEKTVTKKEMRYGKMVDVVCSLNHYDLDKSIKIFKDLLKKDKRKYVIKSRARVSQILRKIKKQKIKDGVYES